MAETRSSIDLPRDRARSSNRTCCYGSASDTVPTPGATRSGFADQSTYVGPRELKLASVSSARANGAVGGRRADGEHPRRVARRVDAAVLRKSRGVLAEVARGRDHDHACVDDALCRERQRVGPVRLVDGGADGQVDDADVVGETIREHPVQRGDDVADGALAVRVEHLQRDDIRIRRDTGLLAVRVVAVARDDAGDVRAVAVVVVRLSVAADEVDERGDALVGPGILR